MGDLMDDEDYAQWLGLSTDFHFMIFNYANHAWYWDIVDTEYKVLMAAVLLFAPGGKRSDFQFYIGMLCSLLFACALCRYWPCEWMTPRFSSSTCLDTRALDCLTRDLCIGNCAPPLALRTQRPTDRGQLAALGCGGANLHALRWRACSASTKLAGRCMVLNVAPVHATLLDVCLYPRHGSQGQGCQAFSHRIGQQYQRGLRNVRQSWLSVRSPIQPIARRRQPQ